MLNHPRTILTVIIALLAMVPMSLGLDRRPEPSPTNRGPCILRSSIVPTLTPLPEPAKVADMDIAFAALKEDDHANVRGMTVTCRGAGRVWGTDTMVETMEELRDLGVNWISIHPYAGISADGTVGSGRIDGMYAETEWLTRPIAEAHRLGLKIMIKPHLAYWGSPFSWRGEIAFTEPVAWKRFFTTYDAWITEVARLTQDADAFAVGTELGGTVAHDGEWRKIIANVREQTTAPLTFASNWDRFEKVPFWDALDVIGIQAYFPLSNHNGVPDASELDTAWAAHMARLEAFARQHERRILFAELGYNRSSKAAITPWDHKSGGDKAEAVQIRCMESALRAIAASDEVVGAFLWKWFPGGARRGNFLMSTPAMRTVIGDAWRLRSEENRRTGEQ